jgi:hypothetical protein
MSRYTDRESERLKYAKGALISDLSINEFVANSIDLLLGIKLFFVLFFLHFVRQPFKILRSLIYNLILNTEIPWLKEENQSLTQ